ncbi:type VI secretion system tip protein VgrG, partial [Pseudomonas entomophila]|nr:type VI secretion system tip protein VgrG [Pseudomonas entomophila]
FNAVSGAAPGPAWVTFGRDPTPPWAPSSYIGEVDWPVQPPDPNSLSTQLESLVDKLPLPKGEGGLFDKAKQLAGSGMDAAKTGMSLLKTGQGAMQSAQQVQGALKGGVAGLPQLASAASSALPAASNALGAAGKAGSAAQGAMASLPSLPKLPAMPKLPAFKAPSLSTATDLLPSELMS